MAENLESAGERTRAALQVVADEHRALGEWRPEQASVRDKLIQALKDAAAAVKDWEALDEAVEQEISDQQYLDEWWYGVPGDPDKPRHVRPPGQGNAQDPGQFSRDEAERICEIPNQKISRWHKALAGDRDEYRELLRGPSWRKAMLERGSTDQRGASGTGENEWCTPAEYIPLVRAVLGGIIDLDPASTEQAQETVKARQYFGKHQNGLLQQWHGRVWLNPPYAKTLIARFTKKMCTERQAGRVTAGMMLTHNSTDTTWFQGLASVADAFCFTRGRVKFYKGNKIANPTQGQVFTYFGDDVGAFASVFADVGFIVEPRRICDVG